MDRLLRRIPARCAGTPGPAFELHPAYSAEGRSGSDWSSGPGSGSAKANWGARPGAVRNARGGGAGVSPTVATSTSSANPHAGFFVRDGPDARRSSRLPAPPWQVSDGRGGFSDEAAGRVLWAAARRGAGWTWRCPTSREISNGPLRLRFAARLTFEAGRQRCASRGWGAACAVLGDGEFSVEKATFVGRGWNERTTQRRRA